MMQDVSEENKNISNDVRTVEIDEDSPSPLQTAEKSQVISSPANFDRDMSGSDDDEASEVSKRLFLY